MTHSLPSHGIDSRRHSEIIERLILLSDGILCVDPSDFGVAFLNRLLSLCDLELLFLLSFLKGSNCWIRFQYNRGELVTPTFADRSRSFTANFRLKRCSEKDSQKIRMSQFTSKVEGKQKQIRKSLNISLNSTYFPLRLPTYRSPAL